MIREPAGRLADDETEHHDADQPLCLCDGERELTAPASRAQIAALAAREARHRARLLAKYRHTVCGRDLCQAFGIPAGRDDALGASQFRELEKGGAQGACCSQNQDTAARLEPRFAKRQIRAGADGANRRSDDAVQSVRDWDARRAVGQQEFGQQEFGQPSVDAWH
jgi:hypothetical protein